MSSLANIAGRLIQIHRSLAEPHSPVPLNVDRVPRREARIDYGHPTSRPLLARRGQRMLHAPTPAAAARWPSLEASTLLDDALSRFKVRSTSAFPDVPKADGWVPAAAPAPSIAEPIAPVDQPEAPQPVDEPTSPPVSEATIAATEPQAIEPRPAIEAPSPTMDPETVAAWILVYLGELLGRIPPSTVQPARREPREPIASVPMPLAHEAAPAESPIRVLPISACTRRIRLRRRPIAHAACVPEAILEEPAFRLVPFPGVPEEFQPLDAPGVPAELLVHDKKPSLVVSDVAPACDAPKEAAQTARYDFNPLEWLLVPDSDRHEPGGRSSLGWLLSIPPIREEPAPAGPLEAAPSALVETAPEPIDEALAPLMPPVPAEPEDPEIIAEPLHRLFSPPTEPEEEEIDDEIPHWFLSLPARPTAEPAVDDIEIPHWLFSIPAEPEDEPNVDESMDWLYSAPTGPFAMQYRNEPRPRLPPAQAPPNDDQIRRRAYELWQAAGSPPSDGREFWHAALRDLGLSA